MTFPRFARILIAGYAKTFTHAQHVIIIIKDILGYLDSCGWSGNYAYPTIRRFVLKSYASMMNRM